MRNEIGESSGNVGAIVLAAGLGTRLSHVGPKPFLFYQNRCFLQIAVENATAIGLNPIVIVTNKLWHQKVVELNLPGQIFVNPHPEQGMLSSIMIGLSEIEHQCAAFFLCPIDYPLVQQNTYQILLSAYQNTPHSIIKPTFHQQAGHPIVIPHELFVALREAPMDRDARSVIRRFVNLEKKVEVDDPGILININTPELYYRYCK